MYPLFIPPEPLLHRRPPKEWTDEQAKLYFHWLLSVEDLRVAGLLKELDLSPVGSEMEVEYLREAGSRVAARLPLPSFSTSRNKGWELTGQGSALAADMGLLVAQFLIKKSAMKIHWDVRKEPTRDASYNLPVLFGTHPRMALDPIGGSLAESKAILRGQSTANIWADTFTHWLRVLLPSRA